MSRTKKAAPSSSAAHGFTSPILVAIFAIATSLLRSGNICQFYFTANSEYPKHIFMSALFQFIIFRKIDQDIYRHSTAANSSFVCNCLKLAINVNSKRPGNIRKEREWIIGSTITAVIQNILICHPSFVVTRNRVMVFIRLGVFTPSFSKSRKSFAEFPRPYARI